MFEPEPSEEDIEHFTSRTERLLISESEVPKEMDQQMEETSTAEKEKQKEKEKEKERASGAEPLNQIAIQ